MKLASLCATFSVCSLSRCHPPHEPEDISMALGAARSGPPGDRLLFGILGRQCVSISERGRKPTIVVPFPVSQWFYLLGGASDTNLQFAPDLPTDRRSIPSFLTHLGDRRLGRRRQLEPHEVEEDDDDGPQLQGPCTFVPGELQYCFRSPAYPSAYGAGEECSLTGLGRWTVHVVAFSVRPSTSCLADYLVLNGG
eukprot:7381772-Prymnesium_polylepis.3